MSSADGQNRALHEALKIAGRPDATPEQKLDAIIESAIAISGADKGYLIIPTPANRYHIAISKNYKGNRVPDDDQVVSRELLENAWDMGDTVVSVFPFATLTGAKGTYALEGNTLEVAGGIRSAIVAPLADEDRMTGAIVLHEKKRKQAFTIDDRRELEPLTVLAAQLLGPPEAPKAAPKPRRGFEELVGEAPVWVHYLDSIEKAAPSGETILIIGESGTGKERAARTLHEKSDRAGKPFVVADMTAQRGDLLHSCLFGHRKGAFTGATNDHRGLFELADGGSIFLDEIGEVEKREQASLLRVLQARTIRPLGSEEEKMVDVRVIAATNKDLDSMAEDGEFRDDLLYRLAVVRITPPTLHERLSDIPVLVRHFMTRFAAEKRCRPKRLTEDAQRKLMGYAWPGNVRELENALRQAWVLAGDSDLIRKEHVPVRAKLVGGAYPLSKKGQKLARLAQALKESNNDPETARKILGIPRATFYDWVKRAKDLKATKSSDPRE